MTVASLQCIFPHRAATQTLGMRFQRECHCTYVQFLMVFHQKSATGYCHIQNSRQKKFWLAKACLVLGSFSRQLKIPTLKYIFKNTFYFNLNKIKTMQLNMQEGLHEVSVKFWKLFSYLQQEKKVKFMIYFKAFQKQSPLKAFKKQDTK